MLIKRYPGCLSAGCLRIKWSHLCKTASGVPGTQYRFNEYELPLRAGPAPHSRLLGVRVEVRAARGSSQLLSPPNSGRFCCTYIRTRNQERRLPEGKQAAGNELGLGLGLLFRWTVSDMPSERLSPALRARQGHLPEIPGTRGWESSFTCRLRAVTQRAESTSMH